MDWNIADFISRLLDNSSQVEIEKNKFLSFLKKEGVVVNPGVSIRGKESDFKKIREYKGISFPKFNFFWNDFGFKRLFYPLSKEGYSGNTYQYVKEEFNRDLTVQQRDESKIFRCNFFSREFRMFETFEKSIVDFELSLDESEVWFYRRRNFHERTIVLKEDENGNFKNIVFS